MTESEIHITKILTFTTRNGSCFLTSCSCGYKSRRSYSRKNAESLAVNHRKKFAPKPAPPPKPVKAPKPPKPPKPPADPDARFLGKLSPHVKDEQSPCEQCRYRRLLAGRLNQERTGPMLITDLVRNEAVEAVLLERGLDGYCCASCKAKAVRGPAVKPARVKYQPWEGRKLSAEKLRERMGRLKAVDSPKAQIAFLENRTDSNREAETDFPEVGRPEIDKSGAETGTYALSL